MLSLIISGETGLRTELYLQRGFLRASRRAIDKAKSTAWDISYAGNRSEPLNPGQVYEMTIQLYPIGHVARRGHKLAVALMSPPTIPYPNWGFMPVSMPGSVTIYHSAKYPSVLELPIVPGIKPEGQAPECGSLEFQPCRKSARAR